MPNYGSKKQNTGGAKSGAGQPASGNFDVGGSEMGFGTTGGARRKANLANDRGLGGGRFKDTDNMKSGGDTRTRRGARAGTGGQGHGSEWPESDSHHGSGQGYGGGMTRPQKRGY